MARTPTRSVGRESLSQARHGWVGLVTALVIPTGIALAAPSAMGPAPGHTGGFGEPTCRECHSDNALNEPSGTLELEGTPAEYTPGQVYRITVRLRRAGLNRGGFQLAARFVAGRERDMQAGQLVTTDDGRVAFVRAPERQLAFAQHTPEGTFGAQDSELRWSVLWQAPRSGARPVVFHVAANASNDDDSELGDFIYALDREVAAAGSDR